MREAGENNNNWTLGNWHVLKDEFGIEVATAFRDGLVNCWRSYQPFLRSEKSDHNQTPICVILGLASLEIESREVESWPNNLTEKDASLACRYAFRELNGFPDWLPKLHKSFKAIVSTSVLNEVKWELSTTKVDKSSHYLLSKLSWSAQWIWDDIAPELLNILKKEPANIESLGDIIKIIQSSSTIPDQQIAKLASKKCKTLKSNDHLAYWFSVWSGVEPTLAIPAFTILLHKTKYKELTTELAMNFIVNLIGDYSSTASARDAYKTPEYLLQLYSLMHDYINEKDDIDRFGKGSYSPGLRDHAQRARDNIFSLLSDISGKQAFLALEELYRLNPEQPWIKRHAKIRAEQDADMARWSVDKFLEFNNTLESTPCNHHELFDLVVQRLLDLKYDIEEGDTSNALILIQITDENVIRNYIAGWCRDNANNRYSIAQEDELADKKRPYLRFNGSGFDAPVPVELKLADNWSGPTLLDRLESQLCGNYLRDERSNRGVFLLVYRGEQTTWKIPNGNQKASFSDLLEALSKRWEQIHRNYPNIDQIEVIGIDLTKRFR